VDVRYRGIFAMAAPGGDRVLWADSISQTYDGERYQFKDVTLSVQLGAKIAVLGGNGGSFVFPSMPSSIHLLRTTG
jgi:ATPase subunit of ABC transporter with duplicated ATPase domains